MERLLYVLDVLAKFIITRYPYVCVFFVLFQAAEQRTTRPNSWLGALYEPTYVHAAIYFLCGAGMTVDLTRRLSGFAAAFHAGYFAVNALLNPSISEWLMIKIFARNIAVFGGYLFVAGGLVDSNVSNLRVSFLQLGRQTQAAYAIFNGYILWASPADKMVHISHLPLGWFLVKILTVLFILCGIMLYGGFHAGYFARLVAWMLLILTVFVEFDTRYWKIRGVSAWDQIHLGTQNVCAIANLILISRIQNW